MAGEQFLGVARDKHRRTRIRLSSGISSSASGRMVEAAVTGQDDGEQEVGVELRLAQQAQLIQHHQLALRVPLVATPLPSGAAAQSPRRRQCYGCRLAVAAWRPNLRGRKPSRLMMLALLPVARITYNPCRSA